MNKQAIGFYAMVALPDNLRMVLFDGFVNLAGGCWSSAGDHGTLGLMQVIQTISEFRSARRSVGRLALVPTMGALHAGHLSLIHVARGHAPSVAVSIFVNPTQFGPQEDFKRYPRPVDADLAACREAGVDLVFMPSPQEMYGPPVQPSADGRAHDPRVAGVPDISIDLPSLTSVLEGRHRPGHFKGVCQVVAKLFHIVQPEVACFGQKDFQQLRIISAMVEALNFPVEIVGCPTLRDPDGLAMSSRNRYLSQAERQQALSISRALFAARDEVASGVRQTNRLITTMRATLLAEHVNIDYTAAVDTRTLQPVEQVDAPTVLAIAAHVGSTRLIDNVIVEPSV